MFGLFQYNDLINIFLYCVHVCVRVREIPDVTVEE